MTELIFQKGLMLIKQICQKNVIFVTIGILKKYLCNGCHDLMQKALSLNVAIAYGKENAYRIHFWYISKNDVTNIMNGSNLVDKRGAL